MDLIQHMKKLLGTEHPYDKKHRLQQTVFSRFL